MYATTRGSSRASHTYPLVVFPRVDGRVVERLVRSARNGAAHTAQGSRPTQRGSRGGNTFCQLVMM